MKKLLIAATMVGASLFGDTGCNETIKPSAAHMEYQKLGVIAIVHWGLNTFVDKDWGFGDTSPDVLRPDRLNTEQWVEAMKSGGIKGVILVCKHHDGFCLWPSKFNSTYSMSAVPAPWKGFDVVKSVSDACRKHGLKFGAYLSPWDRHQGNYATPEYVTYYHNQWKELMTNYGEMFEIWLDGANGGTGWYGGVNGSEGERRKIEPGYYKMEDIMGYMFKLQPKAVAFGIQQDQCVRWCGSETGVSPDSWNIVRKGDDGKMHWMPPEADTPLRQRWFFHASDRPKSLRKLTDAYFTSVGRGATLNLGIAPDMHGLVCHEDVQRLKEFGDYIYQFNAKDFADVCGVKRKTETDGLTTVMTVVLPGKAKFNCIDLREQIADGQNVESFSVEVVGNGVCKKVAEGTTVGIRRLARFEALEASEVKVTLKGCAVAPKMEPVALRFAPFIADDTKPIQNVNGKWKVLDDKESLTIDMGEVCGFTRLDYVPASQGCEHGIIDAYSLEISRDGKNWERVSSGEFDNILANPIPTEIKFEKIQWAQFIRFKATHYAKEGKRGYCVKEVVVYPWN